MLKYGIAKVRHNDVNDTLFEFESSHDFSCHFEPFSIQSHLLIFLT